MKLANAKTLFSLSLSTRWTSFHVFDFLISMSLMTNRDSSKLLQNYNKVGHSVLIGQSDHKNL